MGGDRVPSVFRVIEKPIPLGLSGTSASPLPTWAQFQVTSIRLMAHSGLGLVLGLWFGLGLGYLHELNMAVVIDQNDKGVGS